MISLIFAMGRDQVIGKNNKLPWYLPEDFAYFKKVTTGKTVVMGRKTFASIGRPLPNRKNVILTRDRSFAAEGCTICHTMEEVLHMSEVEELFVIGGVEIYAQFLPLAQRMYITWIDEAFEGDAYFPAINFEEWRLVSKVQGPKDEKNPYVYYFTVYERKS